MLSFDFEDWHQLALRYAGVEDWDCPNAAFGRQVHTVLDLLDELEATATFFLLGVTAKNYPELVEDLLSRGHDVASHGYGHQRVFLQTPGDFRADLEKSVELIEELTGHPPRGYRAPAFSLNRDTVWAYGTLSELGFAWDSSQYDSPRVPRRLSRIPSCPYLLAAQGGGQLLEIPLAVCPVTPSLRLPLGGGSYWRLLPGRVVVRALQRRPDDMAALYFHPYEFDPKPLRVALPAHSTRAQRARATYRSLRADPGRRRLRVCLRRVAQEFTLSSYERQLDALTSRYGARTRSLSEDGVLV